MNRTSVKWVVAVVLAGASGCAMSTSDDIAEMSASVDSAASVDNADPSEKTIAPTDLPRVVPWCACQVVHYPGGQYFDNYPCGAPYPYAVTHTGGTACTANDAACGGTCRLITQNKDGTLGMVTGRTSQ